MDLLTSTPAKLLQGFNQLKKSKPKLPQQALDAYRAKDTDQTTKLIENLPANQSASIISYLEADGNPDWLNSAKPAPPSSSATSEAMSSLFDKLKKTTTVTDTSVSGGAPTGPPAQQEEGVTQQEMEEMWRDINDYDVSAIDTEEFKVYEYQGFSADAILEAMMKKRKKLGISKAQFLKEISLLTGIAMIKGSINDHNIVKMSDKGKANYTAMESKYGITRGGGKDKAPEVITISRIAAAYPGLVCNLLRHKKVPCRKFIGELKTHLLPEFMQHQAMAAIVPQKLAERSRSFILGLITAYSVEQTRAISKTKDDLTVLMEKQGQFVMTTNGANYPEQEVKEAYFRRYNWQDVTSQMVTVATAIKAKYQPFTLISAAEFLADVGSMG
jgi:hypothetical protein